MTVEAETSTYVYVGNGLTLVFAFPSKFLSALDIQVAFDGVAQSGGFTISGAGNDTGGNVTFAVAPVAGVRISLERRPRASQLVDFVNGQTVLEGVLDNALDKLTMIAQSLFSDTGRAVKAPVGVAGPSLPVGVVGRALIYAADGNLQNGPNAADISGAQTNAAVAVAAAAQAAQYNLTRFKTVAAMKASAQPALGVGTIWQGGEFLYGEAEAGASDHNVVTAGDVKLYVLAINETFNVEAFGAKGDGTVDDAPSINAAINAAYALRGARVQLMSRHRVATTIIPRALVHIEGPSRLIVATAAAWRQTAGTQLYGAAAKNITFEPAAGFEGVEVVRLTSPQMCDYDLVFENFNNANNICFNLALAVITTFEPNMRYPFNQANSAIFNSFRIIGSVFGTLITGKGVYGTVPTASPANSANAPTSVITANRWHVDGYFALKKGVDIIGAWDSDSWDYCFINLGANNAIAFDVASDPVFTGNNYVNSHTVQLMLSFQVGVTGGKGIKIGWSFGMKVDIEQDIGPAGAVQIIQDVASQGHYIRTKATGAIDGTSNLLIETNEKNMFHGIANGFASRPSMAFATDRGLGLSKGTGSQMVVSANSLPVALFDDNSGIVALARSTTAIAVDVRARADASALIRFLTQDGATQLARIAQTWNGTAPTLDLGSTMAGSTVALRADRIALQLANGGAGIPGAANDAAAAALVPPVPVGGLYRNGNAVQIRVV